MRIFALFIAFSMVASAAFSQNFFGHLPKPKQPSEAAREVAPIRAHDIVFSPVTGDSTFLGWRPTASIAYSYSKKLGNAVMVFAGFSYEHDTYKHTSGYWTTDWAVSLMVGTGAANAPVTLANATTVAVFGQFFNKLLTVGFGYNFSQKAGLPLLGPGAAFH